MSTLSTLPREEVCPPSGAMAQIGEKSEAASRGDSRHLFLEHIGSLGREKALLLVPEEHRAECNRLDLEGLPLGPEYQTEVAFALRMDGTARILGRGLKRKYEIKEGEIAGTVDVVGPGMVADYKGEHDDTTPPPGDNLQLIGGAIAASSVHGWQTVRLAIIHLREDGSWWQETAEIDGFDLAAGMERIRRTVERVEGARRALEEGAPLRVTRSQHCRWCPAFSVCPATLALARRLAEAPEKVAEEARALLTADTASHALQLTRMARKVLDQVEAEVREFARVYGPIPLPGGKAYGPRQVERLKAGVGLRVLRELYGPDVEDAARKVSASKASISEALEPVAAAEGKPLRKVTEQVFERIRQADGFEAAEEWRDARAAEGT